VVLFYWAAIGVVVGLAAHLLLRSRGEPGYNVFGETLLGALGALTLAMSVGILTGWRRIDLTSGVIALIGATAVVAVVVVLTLRTSPVRPSEPSRPA
jgi:uncharacterized membrane protein YeaQ/YmgE (transglycosylase-associated protein family)